jgi:hypothetical protein
MQMDDGVAEWWDGDVRVADGSFKEGDLYVGEWWAGCKLVKGWGGDGLWNAVCMPAFDDILHERKEAENGVFGLWRWILEDAMNITNHGVASCCAWYVWWGWDPVKEAGCTVSGHDGEKILIIMFYNHAIVCGNAQAFK